MCTASVDCGRFFFWLIFLIPRSVQRFSACLVLIFIRSIGIMRENNPLLFVNRYAYPCFLLKIGIKLSPFALPEQDLRISLPPE